jgi:hypothetical protein
MKANIDGARRIPFAHVVDQVKTQLIVFMTSAADLVALSQTCRWLSNVLRHSRLLRYILDQNLAHQLARFNDIQNLFSLHRGAVLSGSTVLQSYTGDRWLNSDIDIFIPYKKDIETDLVGLFPPLLGNEEEDDDTEDEDNHDNHNGGELSSEIVFHIDNLSSRRKKAVQTVLQQFGLPNDQYAIATVVYSPYAPNHVKFMLTLVQKSLQKQISAPSGAVSYVKKAIQLIFVDMEMYPQYTHCGSVVNFFDLSIVQNYYDGSRFHSNFMQHVLLKEMSLTTSYNGIKYIRPNVMCRLTKYMLNRQCRFLGPFIPLSPTAREIYEEGLRYFNGPVWITEQPIPPADILNGEWIFAAAEADPFFYDSDSREEPEDYRVYWRSLRYSAMIERLEGRPNYEKEVRLKLLMPDQYKFHRRMATKILSGTRAHSTRVISNSTVTTSTTMPVTDAYNTHHSAVMNNALHAANVNHHLLEHPMRKQLWRILKCRQKALKRRSRQSTAPSSASNTEETTYAAGSNVAFIEEAADIQNEENNTSG